MAARKILTTLASIMMITGFAIEAGAETALLPGDAAAGKTLHQARCTACHDDSVYKKNGKAIKSVEGLIGRVQMCSKQTGSGFKPEQVNDVVKYLNEEYYKF